MGIRSRIGQSARARYAQHKALRQYEKEARKEAQIKYRSSAWDRKVAAAKQRGRDRGMRVKSKRKPWYERI